MKRLIKIIAICALSLSLIGCNKTYQEAIDDSITQNNSWCGGYFTRIIEWCDGYGNYRIVYANDTKVKYLLNYQSNGVGITPLYNVDGSLQIYEGE